MPRAAVFSFAALALGVALLGACAGCRGPKASGDGGEGDGGGAPPSARLYFLSDVAGALEPCGCVKDQLGGLERFGALVDRKEPKAKATAVLTAGPLFFMNMELADDRRSQEVAKAGTIASSLSLLGFGGFAPGRNDWAAGDAELAKLTQSSKGSLLAANVTPPLGKWLVKDVGGLRVGVVGVAAPDQAKVPLAGVTSSSPEDAVRAGVAALVKDGADVVIALAAVGRGEAKRIADASPELLAVVVGGTGSAGDANTPPPPPERVGDVLVIETANHLQTAARLDIWVREPRERKNGLLSVADATGIERLKKDEELRSRIDELHAKIAVWENSRTIDRRDVEARKADLKKLEDERAALGKAAAPATGSFYRYEMDEVRDSLGKNEAVAAQMLAYYKKVNEDNKVAFKDRKPPPPAKGEPGYVGVDVCESCHEDAKKVWDGTRHAKAYATLADQYKEFNLDCVSCHVTGYDRPGGSTVTHVASLENVQCEVCHGPGSLHVGAPKKTKVPIPKPGPDACLDCHHPPHVHTFDAKAKMAEILGPGHGKPL